MRKREMSLNEALKKAVKVVGNKATVKISECYLWDEHRLWQKGRQGPPQAHCNAHKDPCPGARRYYMVGRIELGMFNMILGQGLSWEEALSAAAQRLKKGL